jgi:hypothetical protein
LRLALKLIRRNLRTVEEERRFLHRVTQPDHMRTGHMIANSLLLRIGIFFGVHAGVLVGLLAVL